MRTKDLRLIIDLDYQGDNLSNEQLAYEWKVLTSMRAICKDLTKAFKKTPSNDILSHISTLQNTIKKKKKLFYRQPAYYYSLEFKPTRAVKKLMLRHGQKVRVSFNHNDDLLSDFKIAKKQLQNQIQEYRQNSKHIRQEARVFNIRTSDDNHRYQYNVVGNKKIGYIFASPGTIVTMFNWRRARRALEAKTPTTKDNYVGIELELYSGYERNNLANLFLEDKLENYVQIKHDGSIRPTNNLYPNEVTILCKETEYETIINRVCATLKRAGAKTNLSCGMHVHVDMRQRNKELVFANLVRAQDILYLMNPKSRKESRYCKKTESAVFNSNAQRGDRYQGINPASYPVHNTIEIRIHTGTLNAVRINNWIKLLLAITNKAEEVKRSPKTFKGFVKTYGIDLDLATYIGERIVTFSKVQDEGEEVA